MTFAFQVLFPGFLACVVLTLLLSYLGLHVLAREVLFVDIALAQIAGLGTALADLRGIEPHTTGSFFYSLVLTFLGAALFAFSRGMRKTRIPQEAFIGIVYAIAAALSILVANFLPHGDEEIKEILVGSLLTVELKEVGLTALIFLVLGLFHFAFRKKFLRLSFEEHHEEAGHGLTAMLWDLAFYMSFAVVICTSVQRAGVLLVFSFLVVPAVFSALFSRRLMTRLLICWALGIAVSAVGIVVAGFGLVASAMEWESPALQLDLPVGATIVVTFGVFLFAGAIVRALMRADPKVTG